MFLNAAGNNSAKMRKVWVHIDTYAVKAHPFFETNPYGGDFLFAAIFADDPHTNPSTAPLCRDVEDGKGVNYPLFQPAHKGGDISPALA